jgi:hypothetical protein
MCTESYGKGLKEAMLIPYLKKAVDHPNPEVQKIAIRFIISLKTFNILGETDVDRDIIAETFYEKYLRAKNPEFLRPLKITFKKLQKEGKLEKFLKQIGEGVFSKDIIKELTFQLWYRDIRKMEEALQIIDFLLHKLGIQKEDFVPFLEDFIHDIDKRIYLADKKDIKERLKKAARDIIRN